MKTKEEIEKKIKWLKEKYDFLNERLRADNFSSRALDYYCPQTENIWAQMDLLQWVLDEKPTKKISERINN